MKTIITSNWRPLRRALCTLLIAIVAPQSWLLRRAICASLIVVPAVLSLVATAPAYADPTLTGTAEFSTDTHRATSLADRVGTHLAVMHPTIFT